MEKAKIIDDWLQELEILQAAAANLPFPPGSIPSYRVYPLSKIKRADPNVFYPALVANKLLEFQSLMNEVQKNRAASITKQIQGTFPLYKSRRGRMHYNFWPTKPDVPFPNGEILHRFDFFRLPDDTDDTALVYQANQASTGEVQRLQQDIESHCSMFYPNYHRLYPAWLGEKMPFVVDVCVITNLLHLFETHTLAPTTYSTLSALFLAQVIRDKTYISSPYVVSPYYPDTAVIAYHLSKWLAASETASSESKERFINDLQELAYCESNPFKAMLFSSSLLRLNAEGPFVGYDQIVPWLNTFPWFVGSMLSAVKSGAIRRFGNWKLFHITHVCESWNQSLWTEYALLRSLHTDKLSVCKSKSTLTPP